MDTGDALTTAGRFLQAALEDDDLRKTLRDARRSGRKLESGVRGRRKAAPQTLAARASETLRASGAAFGALRDVEPEPESHPRRTVVAVLVMGGLVAAVAAQTKTNDPGRTHGV